MEPSFAIFQQEGSHDCGYACLRMVGDHFGLSLDFSKLGAQALLSTAGLSLAEMKGVAADCGLHCMAHWWELSELAELKPLPCVALVRGSHFVVVYEISEGEIHVADPAFGLRKYTHPEFCSLWLSDGRNDGIVLTFSRPN